MIKASSKAKPKKFHVKRGDNVLITVGDYKGLSGIVAKVCRKTSRLVVDGVEKIKRSPRKQHGGSDAPVLLDRFIHVSNVKKIST